MGTLAFPLRLFPPFARWERWERWERSQRSLLRVRGHDGLRGDPLGALVAEAPRPGRRVAAVAALGDAGEVRTSFAAGGVRIIRSTVTAQALAGRERGEEREAVLGVAAFKGGHPLGELAVAAGDGGATFKTNIMSALTGIPAGTTISSVTASTIVMSANASSSGTFGL